MSGYEVRLHSGGLLKIEGNYASDLVRAVIDERDREFLVAIGQLVHAFEAGDPLASIFAGLKHREPAAELVPVEDDEPHVCVDPTTDLLIEAVCQIHALIVSELDSDPCPHPADYVSDPQIVELLRELIAGDDEQEENDREAAALTVVEDDTPTCTATTYLDGHGTIQCELPQEHAGAHHCDTYHASWPADDTHERPGVHLDDEDIEPPTEEPAEPTGLAQRVFEHMAEEPGEVFTAVNLASELGAHKPSVSCALSDLVKAGRINRVGRGEYAA